MRASWEGIRRGLIQWIESREAASAFERLTRRAPTLERFSRPSDLVDAVVQTTDLETKDRVLAALITAAGAAETRRLAQALLMLCLWPGLDAIFHRRIIFFRRDPQDLAAEIADRFTRCVHRIDLRRVSRITATLVRNTERELVDARRKESAVETRSVELPADLPERLAGDVRESPFGVPCGRWDATSVAALRSWLSRTVGRDADLVIDAILLEKSGGELARTFGLSPVAARKRLGRALVRARHAYLTDGESQATAEGRFC
jgi:RNA polymerase sigma-70 factor (ECF subfamily)